MASAQIVDSEAFRKKLAPTVASIREFAEAVGELGSRKGTLPWDKSPGMREISNERKYAERCAWENPVTETHVLGGLTLRAAADYARTFAESFAAEHTPLYGHLVLARAGL